MSQELIYLNIFEFKVGWKNSGQRQLRLLVVPHLRVLDGQPAFQNFRKFRVRVLVAPDHLPQVIADRMFLQNLEKEGSEEEEEEKKHMRANRDQLEKVWCLNKAPH